MADGYTDPNVFAAQRRSAVFDALLNRSLQPQDIRSPLQGLAGIGSTLVAALMARRSGDQLAQAYGNAAKTRSQHILDAFGGGSPDTLAGSDGTAAAPGAATTSALAGRSVSPGVLALMQSPDTADIGQQMLVAEMSRQPQRGYNVNGKIIDAQGNLVADYSGAAGASSSVGKLAEDLKAGRIDQATYDAQLKKENYITPVGGVDQGAWKPLSVDETKTLGLNPGTVALRNVRTGEIQIKQAGQGAEAGPFSGKGAQVQAMNLALAGAEKIKQGLAPDDPGAYEMARQYLMQPHSTLDSASGQVVTSTPIYDLPAFHQGGTAPAPTQAAPVTAGQPNIYDPAAAAAGTPMQPADPQQTTQVPGTNVSVTQIPGKQPGTPAQLQIAGYRDRLAEADKIIADTASAGTSYAQQGLSHVPLVGNYLKSEDRQKQEQARRDFVNANLRRESGAAISQSEFDNAEQQYFPQPGDSEAVLAQKAHNRATIINNFKREAGRVPELSGPGTGHPEPPPGFQILP